jgi:hypothetical protein
MAIPYLCAQSLERTELELFDGAFGFAEAPGDFTDAAFLDKALPENTALYVGKLIDETNKMNVALDEIEVSGGELWRGQWMLKFIGLLFAIRAFVVINDGVGGDTIEPGGEGGAAPFIAVKIGERFVKHFRG